MKWSMVLGAAALVVREAAAADCMSVALSAIPACAQSCILNGAPEIGCGATDFTCQCNKQPALMAAIEGCVQSACKASEFQSVIDGGAKVCKCVGADVQVAGGSMSGSYAATGSAMPSVTAATPAATTTGSVAGYPTVAKPTASQTAEPTPIVSSGANAHAAAGLLAGVAAAVALL